MKKILLGLVILCMVAGNAFATQTVTILKRENWGASRITYGEITHISESYTAEGVTLSARTLGLDNMKILSITGIGSAVYSYAYDYTNEKMLLYYSNNNDNKPASSPATSDYFIVTDDNSADSNGEPLLISPIAGTYAQFVVADGFNVSGSGDYTQVYLAAADSSTLMAVGDTTTTWVALRDKWIFADTLFFDDDATLASDRLMYSGTQMGNHGDFYVPFGNGNFIKVLKKTSLHIYTAGAQPLYWDIDGGLDDKLLSVCEGNANSTFSVDWKYSSLPAYYQIGSTELRDGTSYTVQFRFIAVGN